MLTYNDKCPYCDAPSNNADNAIYCSNPNCWKVMIGVIANHRKETRGFTPDNPKVVRCPKCNQVAKILNGISCKCAYCEDSDEYAYTFKRDFVVGHWYHFRNRIIQYIDKKPFWNYKTQIKTEKIPPGLKKPYKAIPASKKMMLPLKKIDVAIKED